MWTTIGRAGRLHCAVDEPGAWSTRACPMTGSRERASGGGRPRDRRREPRRQRRAGVPSDETNAHSHARIRAGPRGVRGGRAARRGRTPGRRTVSGLPGAGWCSARLRARRADHHASSRACARAVRRAGAARRRLRHVAARPSGQLGAGRRPRGGRGRAHHRRGRDRRACAGSGHAVGGRRCARRDRGPARRRGRHRGAAPAATAAPPADHPRGREPAQRRECAADLPPRRRRRRGGKLLAAGRGADVPVGRLRQPGGRPGAGLADPTPDEPYPARSHRDHPAVRQHVHGLAAGGASRVVRRAHHGLLRDDAGPHRTRRDPCAHPHPDECGLGDGDLRAEHLRVHLHRPAGAAHRQRAAGGRAQSPSAPDSIPRARCCARASAAAW